LLGFVVHGWAFMTGAAAPADEPAKAGGVVTVEPLVVGSEPPPTDPSNEPKMPSLGVGGVFPQPPKSLTSPFVVHEGSFTWGPDLAAQTVSSGDQGADECAWKKLFGPTCDSSPSAAPKYTAAPAFTGYVDGMLARAHDRQAQLEGGAIGGAFDAFEKIKSFLGEQDSLLDVGDRVDRFLGFHPVRARWLRSQWSGGGGTPLFKPETKYFYPDFFAFGDIRQRGARLYCAARRARFAQGDSVPSLGERTAYSFGLLGRKIDLMVLRSTVVLDGPERCTGGLLDPPECGGSPDGPAPNDGAQAFAIPLLFGNTLYAIRGLGLPPIDEVRVPLVLVTGDTEVSTAAEKRPVYLGTINEPDFVTLYSKEFRTVTHLDAILSAQRHFGYGPVHLPLLKLGPAEVFLEFDFQYDVGGFGVPADPLSDDRLIEPTGLLAAWPKPARNGWLLANPFSGPLPGYPPPVHYHDGAWRFGLVREPGKPLSWQWQVVPDGKNDPYWRQPLLPVLRPHDLRALTDDDHRIASATSATLTATIGGGLVADFGPFETELTIEGGLGVSVTQEHLLRDALMAQDANASALVEPRMRPISALSVRGVASSSLNFTGLTASLHFELSLAFTDIEFDKTLFKVGGKAPEEHSTDAIAPKDEEFILRVGTGSRDGVPMTKPRVLSHLPGGAEFETFDQDVAACLEDPTPNPPPPPPCQEPLDGGSAPKAEVCLYGSGSSLRGLKPFPPGVCSNIPGYVSQQGGLNPAQKACVSGYLGFLCQPQSAQQTFKGASVVGRVWNFDEAMSLALHAIVSQCVDAFVPQNDPNYKSFATAVSEQMISGAVCTAKAHLLEDATVMSVPTEASLEPQAPQTACGS
jgi:hypothetical protein